MSGEQKTYKQEACLGRVRTARGKKLRYLVKWQGYDSVGDVTCEPDNNMRVPRKEEPLLTQSSDTFQADLERLLDEYLEQRVKAPPPEADDDSTSTSESSSSSHSPPPSKAPVKKEAKETSKRKAEAEPAKKRAKAAPEAPAARYLKVTPEEELPAADPKGETLIVPHRQFLLPEDRHVHRSGPLAALFLHVRRLALNVGLGWAIAPNLRCNGAHPDSEFLGGSVDRMSEHVGFGWFAHHLSGVSLGGERLADRSKHPYIKFVVGDTVGLVVDTVKSVGYAVRNGRTVFQVPFSTCQSQPMQFAVHLCPDDAITFRPPPAPLEKLVNPAVPTVTRGSR